MSATGGCPFPKKRKYATEGAALAMAVRTAQHAVALRAYICPNERHWHLTSEVGVMVKPAKPRTQKQWRRDAEKFRARY